LKPGQLVISTLSSYNSINTLLIELKSTQAADPILITLISHLKDPINPCPKPFIKFLKYLSLTNDILYFDTSIYIPDNIPLKL